MSEVGCNGDNNNDVNSHFEVINSPKNALKFYQNNNQLYNWLIPMLRLLVLVAMVSATLIMALNKQDTTISIVIGNTSIPVKATAKSKYLKAYVFFVIANAVGSLCTISVLAFEIFGNKSYIRKLHRSVILILDMIIVALVSVGTGGATFMGEMARNGNSHTNWIKVCDKIESFCNVGIVATILSYIGIGLLIILNAIAIKNQAN